MPRWPVFAILLCACRPAATEPATAKRPRTVDDGTMERLQLFEQAGLPSMLGWSRVHQIVGIQHDGAPRCRNVWVQQQGAHRVVIDDELDVDWGGLWLARWPAQMRVARDAYAIIDPVVRLARGRRMGRVAEPTEQPSDMLAEVTVSLQGTVSCGSENDGRAVVSLVRAGWVHSLGHTQLARKMIARWNMAWSDESLREAVAEALRRFATDSLRQGMPRAQVRPWLERAAATCDCIASQHAQAQLAVLGDDPSTPIVAGDPEALLEWLADDLLYPHLVYVAETNAGELHWPTPQMPRSPAHELYALGWAALPVLVESDAPARLMRVHNGPTGDHEGVALYTTLELRRRLASHIALREFDDDQQMRAWWTTAAPRGEMATHIAALGIEDWAQRRVRRLLALDRADALVRIERALAGLDRHARARVVAAVLEFGGAVDRRWIGRAIAAVRSELDSQTFRDELMVDLLVAVARADPRRGAALLRDVQRRLPVDDGAGIVEEALGVLCEPEDAEPMPDCRPPLRRMFDAVSSRP